jgi:sulfate transport system permease protein
MTSIALPRRRASGAALPSVAPGVAITYLSLIVLLPLSALLWQSKKGGFHAFWAAVSSPDAVAALELTLGASLLVAGINAVFGTLIAWVLVRDSFRGKAAINSLIDLPFALPTVVAGLTLLTLYGPYSPIGLNITYTRIAVVVALLFETLPFVIRSVQPVLLEFDTDMEDAAASLGAGSIAIFRRIVFPNLLPAILSGVALAFARAVGEFGAVVLISGNIPFKTEVASVHIFSQVESDAVSGGAALSVVLLGVSLVTLFAFDAVRRWRFSGGS